MVYRVARRAGQPITDRSRRRLPHLARGAGRASWSTAAGAPSTGRSSTGVDARARRRSASGWTRFWERSRRRGRRPAGGAAGGPLEPLPARPGRGPRRAVRRPGQGRHRLRLRRPLLLGHRDLRAAVPHLHLAADGPQRAALPLQAARRGPACAPSELAQSGALFPWRTINGEEASAYYAAGTAQYHIDADISYALMQVRRRHRRPGLPARARASTSSSRPPGCGPTSASGASNGDGRRPSTSTASPGRTSTPPSSTTTCSPT